MTTQTISEIANANFEATFYPVITAKEMELNHYPYTLSQCSNYARTKTSLYIWSDSRNGWVKIDDN